VLCTATADKAKCKFQMLLRFPAHVFFDDAFELSDDNDNEVVVNRFVRDLMNSIDKAATDVHSTECHIRPPVKFPTPYGGRLVWTLPGKTKMIVHLKNKDKIRHKKRWSQVNEPPFSALCLYVAGSVEAIPLQAWTGPEGCRRFGLLDFKTTCKVVSPKQRLPLPLCNILGIHSC
jgi:hypothetical protein